MALGPQETQKINLIYASFLLLVAVTAADFLDNMLWGDKWSIPGVVITWVSAVAVYTFGREIWRRTGSGDGGKDER